MAVNLSLPYLLSSFAGSYHLLHNFCNPLAKLKQINAATFLVDLRRSLAIIWDAHRPFFILILLLIVFQAFLPVLSLYFIKEIIDEIITPARFNYRQIILPVVGFTATQFLLAASIQFAAYITTLQQQKVSDHMSVIVLEKAMRVDMEYYENPSYHDSLHLAQQQSQNRVSQLLSNVNALVLNGLSLLFLTSLFLTFQWRYAVIFILVSVPLAIVKWYYNYQIVKIELQHIPHERESSYLHNILTSVSFAKEVRAFGTGNYFVEKYRIIRSLIYNGKTRVQLKLTCLSIAAYLLEAIVITVVFIFIAKDIYASVLPASVFIIYLQGFQRLQSTSKNFLQSFVQLFQTRLYINDLFKFLDINIGRQEAQDKKFPVLKAGLNVRDLSFKYPGSDAMALHNISLNCAPGEIIAIVGENGSGKSTLVKLLTRMYNASQGQIAFDNTDLADIQESSFRENSIVLFQDFEKYFFSVKENISWSNAADIDEEIIAAAKDADAHSFIGKLKESYDTRLGRTFANSAQLSGGQWQKIAFARVFYKNAKFVVLDEPTSSIDAIAERDIYSNLKQQSKGKVTILISHRVYNLKIADRIYVLKNGEMIQCGSYENLIREKGSFKTMFVNQQL